MSLTVTDLFRKTSKLKGYKPRIGISIAGIGEHFSAYREFASDTTFFKGITKGQPRVRQSCDRLGGLAKVSGINLSVLNLELWSDIFNTYANVENEDVEAFLYFDMANIARQSLLFDSSLNQYLEIDRDAQLNAIFPIFLEVWVMFTDAAIGSNTYLFVSNDQSDYSGIWIQKSSNDKIEISYGDDSGGSGTGQRRTRQGDTTTIVANRWYCIHALFKGAAAAFFTNAKIYINGVEEAAYIDTGTAAGGVAYAPAGEGVPSRIGRKQAGYSDVYIAQVGFWDAELSAADALSLYGDGTPKDLELPASYDSDKSGDLQGYWKFQNMVKQIGDDTYVLEETGNTPNAVLLSFPLWSWNIPCCLDTDRLQFFKGKVSDFPTIDYEKVGLKADSLNPFKDKTIGTLITESDATTDFTLPTQSFGKLKPIIYGNHLFYLDNTDPALVQTTYDNNMIKLIPLGGNEYLISGHKLNEIEAIWGWDTDIERFVKAESFTTEQNSSSGAIISISSSQKYYDFWFGNGTTTPIVLVWQDAARAGNRDFSNYALAQIAGADPINYERTEDINFDTYDNDGIENADISQLAYFARSSFDVSDPTRFDFKIAGVDVDTRTDDPIYLVSDAYVTTKAQIATAIRIQLKKVFASGELALAKVYQVYKRIEYTPSQKLDLFASVKGREYGTWINGRAVAEGYTETHLDDDVLADFGSGASEVLIENAAGIIESLLRDGLNQVDAEILMDSFNISSNDLSTSKLSFSITEQIKNSERLFDDILRSVKSVMFNDNNNQSKMRTFVSGDPYSVSGDSVPNNEDIFEFDPQTTFKIDSGNNKLYIDGSTITLTVGEYTGTTLAAHIETKLEDLLGANQINCTYSAGKFTFTEVAGGPYTLKWNSGGSNNIGRFIGFDISADDTLLTTKISDYPLWADSYVENPIVKRPLPKIGKTKDDIKTTVVVNYFLNPNGEYNKSITDTDVSFHAETLEKVFNHPYTRDQVTAEIYLYFLSKNSDHTGRLSKKYLTEKFYSWLNAMIFEPWDFINVREPVINGILGSANAKTQKWLITEVEPGFNNIRVGITTVEV